jgi:hypothetical protein
VWVNLRPTVSRPVCPGVRRPSGTCDQFFFCREISFYTFMVLSFAVKFLFTHLWFCKFVAPSLTRGWVCKLLYNCFWALPEQSLLGRSPAELTAFFYCLIRDSTNLEGQVPVFQSHVSAVRNFQFLPLGGLHGKHAVQRGIWLPTQHLLWDHGKPRKTLIELASFSKSKSKSHYDRHMSWPVCLGVRHPSGTRDQICYLLEILC